MSSKRKVYWVDRLAYRGLILMSKLTIAAVFAAALSIFSSAFSIAEPPSSVHAVQAQLERQAEEAEASGEDLSWKDRIKGMYGKVAAAGGSFVDGVIDKDEREKRKDKLIADQNRQIAELQDLLISQVSMENVHHTKMLLCVDELGKYLKDIPTRDLSKVAPSVESVKEPM